MKRSVINSYLKESEAFIKKIGFSLPPFAGWTPEEWNARGHECD